MVLGIKNTSSNLVALSRYTKLKFVNFIKSVAKTVKAIVFDTLHYWFKPNHFLMSQKINTNLLHAGHRLGWESVWCDGNSKFTSVLFRDLETKHYKNQLVNTLNFIPPFFALRYFNNKIGLYAKLINKRHLLAAANASTLWSASKLQLKSLKLLTPLNLFNFLMLYEHKNSDKTSNMPLILFNYFYQTANCKLLPFLQSKIISNHVEEQIQTHLRQNGGIMKTAFLQYIGLIVKQLINDKQNAILILGIAIQCNGKWSKTNDGRQQKLNLSIGQVAKNSTNFLVSFGSSKIYTKFGVSTIKVWVCYNIL